MAGIDFQLYLSAILNKIFSGYGRGGYSRNNNGKRWDGKIVYEKMRMIDVTV